MTSLLTQVLALEHEFIIWLWKSFGPIEYSHRLFQICFGGQEAVTFCPRSCGHKDSWSGSCKHSPPPRGNWKRILAFFFSHDICSAWKSRVTKGKMPMFSYLQSTERGRETDSLCKHEQSFCFEACRGLMQGGMFWNPCVQMLGRKLLEMSSLSKVNNLFKHPWFVQLTVYHR